MKRSLLAPAGVPPKAARLVADVLTERIVEGEYVPGDLLPSADDLIAEFGISRPTLREALNRLESAGFVSLRRGPGGGARVRAPDQSEVVRALDALLRFEDTSPLHIMEVRLVLEPAAAAMAALRATDDELDELEANLIRQASSDIVDEPRPVVCREARVPIIDRQDVTEPGDPGPHGLTARVGDPGQPGGGLHVRGAQARAAAPAADRQAPAGA